MRYPIGNRFRAARARLEQVAGCEPDALPDAVAQIAALPSLHGERRRMAVTGRYTRVL